MLSMAEELINHQCNQNKYILPLKSYKKLRLSLLHNVHRGNQYHGHYSCAIFWRYSDLRNDRIYTIRWLIIWTHLETRQIKFLTQWGRLLYFSTIYLSFRSFASIKFRFDCTYLGYLGYLGGLHRFLYRAIEEVDLPDSLYFVVKVSCRSPEYDRKTLIDDADWLSIRSKETNPKVG